MQSHSTPSLYHKAISFMVSAYFSITLMNVFVKTASQTIPASETLFSRFLIGFLFLLPFVIKDRDFKVDTRQWKFLILRNAAGVSSMLINFLCREVLTAFHRCLIDEYLCPILSQFYCSFSIKKTPP